MENLVKVAHSAGGFQFFITENKGNSRLSKEKQEIIINALKDSCTEGVYQLPNGTIKKQLLNGNAKYLVHDYQNNCYSFC